MSELHEKLVLFLSWICFHSRDRPTRIAKVCTVSSTSSPTSESLAIERVHFRRAIFDLEQVAPLVDGGGLLRTFTIDGESV